jgi:hypothetical protein
MAAQEKTSKQIKSQRNFPVHIKTDKYLCSTIMHSSAWYHRLDPQTSFRCDWPTCKKGWETRWELESVYPLRVIWHQSYTMKSSMWPIFDTKKDHVFRAGFYLFLSVPIGHNNIKLSVEFIQKHNGEGSSCSGRRIDTSSHITNRNKKKKQPWEILVILFPKHAHEKSLGVALFSCWHGPMSFQTSRFVLSSEIIVPWK